MMLAMTEPAVIPLAGASWRVLYNLWAVRKIEERYSPVGDWLQSGLEGFQKARMDLAAGQIDALAAFLWAGLLHESPALRFEDALALLDEAAPGELVTLPPLILDAVLQATGRPSGSGGEPWSWPVALAAWVSEWGRSEQEFWQATFRTLGAISDGRAHLYRSAKDGGGSSRSDRRAEGWTLMELLTMKGR